MSEYSVLSREVYFFLPVSHQCTGNKSLQFYGTVQTNSLAENSILYTAIN